MTSRKLLQKSLGDAFPGTNWGFEAAGEKEALIYYNRSVYLEKTINPSDIVPGFDGRFAAIQLTKTVDSSSTATNTGSGDLNSAPFLVISYHGRWTRIPNKEPRIDHARTFVKGVGDYCAKKHITAIIGGDWNVSFAETVKTDVFDYAEFIFNGKNRDKSPFVPHFRFPEKMEPDGLSCQRLMSATIDYFCLIEPSMVSFFPPALAFFISFSSTFQTDYKVERFIICICIF